ncbi:MAG: ISAs1 family transposase, partial [Aquiluna sp.]
MGTQTEIARQIIRQGGDYILALKSNQGKLYQGVKEFFEQAQQQEWAGTPYTYDSQVEGKHHRIERREIWVVPVSEIPELANASKWEGLGAIVKVRRHRRLWNKSEEEISYYITSLKEEAAVLACYIRAHWSIENNCHWVLDVTFKEDRSRIRKQHGAENTALLRRLCLNLLKRDTSRGSLVQKRYRAAMDDIFMLSLLGVEISS